MPRGSAECDPSARDGAFCSGRAADEEQGSPVCSTRDQRHLSGERGCRTAGCERGLYARAGCHAAPEGKGPYSCEYRGDRCGGTSIDLSACAAARLRSGSKRLRSSQASLNSNCQKTGESNFSSPTTRHVACNVVVNAFQQYEGLVNLATAKLERRCTILGLAHPPLREIARIHWRFTRVTC